MEKKRRIKFISFGTLLGLLSLLIFTVASTTAAVISAVINTTEHYFDVTVSNIPYRCFVLSGEGNNVAISYGANPEDTNEVDIIVPSTVTNPETSVSYTVKAVNTAGFRYCNFTHIKLPQTVEEIGEEAFAYCQKMITFNIPHLITKIAPSTFLDCTSLDSIYYTNSSDARTFGNDQITEIGDHAFDSCRSLRSFYAPTNATYFGESCFQRCEHIVNFYFPSSQVVNNVVQNPLIVRPYAFADCTNLVFIYFETNMQEIDNYAFTDCSLDLHITYTGNAIPSYTRDNVDQAHWRDVYIQGNKTELIPVDYNHPVIHADTRYPCIRYTIENTPVKLDSGVNSQTPGVNGTSVFVIPQSEITAEGEYAVIYKFDTPTEDVEGCFDVDTGALTIPNEVDGKTVKVIRQSTFVNNMDITSVTFNEDLVQICNKAFYGCLNIESLDFSQCNKLKEVSYFCFQDGTDNMKNTKVEEIILPDCLEYVGCYAFSNFTKVNSFSLPNNIQAIADLAFYRLGYDISKEDASIDLILPKSLNDKAAQDAYFIHQKSPGGFEHKNRTRWYAVGKYSFNCANGIRTIKMEADPTNINEYGMNKRCSFYSNAFKECKSLLRFEASENLAFLGKDAFKDCPVLREVMLTTHKSNNLNSNYPWCIDEENGNYGGTLFFNTSPELVIYLDNSAAPGLLETWSNTADSSSYQVGHKWNVETNSVYTNQWKDVAGATQNQNGARVVGMSFAIRTCIPTYYSVNFTNGITYWDPATKAIAAKPFSLEDYNDGIISLVKDTNGNYSVARYWASLGEQLTTNPATYAEANGTALIDLTSIPGISDSSNHKLVKIGDEAFARSNTMKDANNNNKKAAGSYFILPDTITTIGERAFYRRTDNAEGNYRYGVRIITYKDSSTNKLFDADGNPIDNLNASITATESGTEKLRTGFCVLPSSVTRIEKVAFYNHIFKKIRLGSNLTFVGHGAFWINNYSQSESRSYSTDLTFTANSFFKEYSGGLYYKGGGSTKQILMFQVAGSSDTLTIDTDTKAIGMQGCSNTSYKTIELPTTLTTIYGGGMTRNIKLTTVTGVSGLRYIGSMENAAGTTNWDDPGYTEVWDSSVDAHFDNVDYRDFYYDKRGIIEGLYGAFAKCGSLKNINFKSMTELRKIGWAAFDSCGSMNEMTGGDKYTIKDYVASSNTFNTRSDADDSSTGILDLQPCAKLRSINREAFVNCNAIKYCILPDNKTNSDTESTLYLGRDLEAPYYNSPTSTGAIFTANKGIKVLVGETAEYANVDFGKTHSASSHYPATVFGNGNTVYYYVGSTADLPSGDSTGLKYWTKYGGHYILLDNKSAATTFYSHYTSDPR